MIHKRNAIVEGKADGAKLGAFGGVFTPSLPPILGIILFLRLGFVVGNAGLRRALVIIAIAETGPGQHKNWPPAQTKETRPNS